MSAEASAVTLGELAPELAAELVDLFAEIVARESGISPTRLDEVRGATSILVDPMPRGGFNLAVKFSYTASGSAMDSWDGDPERARRFIDGAARDAADIVRMERRRGWSPWDKPAGSERRR